MSGVLNPRRCATRVNSSSTEPHTPPKDPALQDTADVPSSRTPQHITALPPVIPRKRSRDNKLPLRRGLANYLTKLRFDLLKYELTTYRYGGPISCKRTTEYQSPDSACMSLATLSAACPISRVFVASAS